MSARLYLRELLHEDVTDNYLSWFRNNEVTSFLEVDGNSLTVKDVTDYIDEGNRTGNYKMFAICLLEGNKHIGNLKVGPINKKHAIADLVCVIGDRSYWGKGLATDAIALGNQLAFDQFNIRKLHGQIYADNIGSVKAYCKAGWIIEGIIQGRYWVDGKPMDQILVSCNNPKYFDPAGQTTYNIDQLEHWIQFRKGFTE
jgi:[ribosomal protein S5]-alanine N-acetyltransferase